MSKAKLGILELGRAMSQQSTHGFPLADWMLIQSVPAIDFATRAGPSRAYDEVGFPGFDYVDFPEARGGLSGVGASSRSRWKNRVIAPSRPDFADYIRRLDLPEKANPIEILTVNGGFRTTDSFEVFPKLVKRPDGSFVCRFFLHGWRYVSEPAQEKLDHLTKGEELHVALELTNPKTEVAVQIQTTDYQMIGWAPRYLVPDLMMAEAPGKYEANVVRINLHTTPLRQRFLIEMRSYWEKHEPMVGDDYNPLVD